MRIRPVLSGLTLALLAAKPAFALDLAEAYQKALNNDPSWAATQHNFQATQENLNVSQAYLLPSLDLNGSISHNSIKSEGVPGFSAGGTTDYRQNQYGAKITQPLFRADAWYAYKEAKASTSQAESDFHDQQQQFILRVAQSYFDVLRSQESLEYSKAEEAALGRQMDQAQQRFDVGLIAITDVLEARAQYDAARASRISAEAQLNTARENLAIIIGDNSSTLAPLKADAPMSKPVPDNAEDWVKLARDKNPQLTSARYAYETSKAATHQIKAAYLPNVDLYGQYNKTDIPGAGSNISLAFQNTTTTAVGVSATWNVFGGGRTYYAARQASYKEAAAQDGVTSAERNVVSNTRTAFLNVAANSFQVEARKQAVKSNESAMAATQAGYEVGTRNIVDVLLTESNLYAAKRDYASSRYDYVINSLKLKAASGQLSEIDIKELNNWLDPNGSITASPEAPAESTTPAASAPAKAKQPAKKK